MIVALHQPHFCPWLGYFDRMRQADLFVLLDHVAHQPESYASRVRVKSGDASQWLSVPLEPSSRPEPIALKRLEAVAAGDPWPRRVLAALGAAYGAAPHFQETFEKLQGVLRAPEGRLVDLNRRLIELIKEALDIRTPIIHSSALGVGGENTELAIAVCRAVGADTLLCGLGAGSGRLDAAALERAGIRLRRQEFRHPRYVQNPRPDAFVEGLSALDLLFNCGAQSGKVLRGEPSLPPASPESPAPAPRPQPALPRFGEFRVAFDPRDKERLYRHFDEILATQQWADGRFTRLFEERWSAWNGLPALSMSSWAGGALAALEYFQLRGRKVLCPTNTFIGTPLSVLKAGAEVVFGDCNREDLCLSYEAVARAAAEHDLAAVWLVHIGGHLAFDSDKIAQFCAARDIVLLEDCAHAHGASWNGRKPGSWGDAGVFSFYATKSVPTGEGGMLVSKHQGLIDFARRYRSYGLPERAVEGLNHRMTEFTAALGLVQAERMEEVFAWKNEMARRHLDPVYPNRVRLPPGMVSGYYKYIVFEPVARSSSRVYADLCHQIMRKGGSFPNAEWAARNHWCVPFYYSPGLEADEQLGQGQLPLAPAGA